LDIVEWITHVDEIGSRCRCDGSLTISSSGGGGKQWLLSSMGEAMAVMHEVYVLKESMEFVVSNAIVSDD